MIDDIWPLFTLRVRTPRLELRVVADDDIAGLVEVARAGVHPPDTMPFLTPWTALPEPDMGRGLAQWIWKTRAEFSIESWGLPLGVVVDGRMIGVQGVDAINYLKLRTVSSGSWLGEAHQGQGIGTEMRAAMLHLAFEGLGAKVATSEARAENLASLRVTEKLGYEANGLRDVLMGGTEPTVVQQFRLTREIWEEARREDISVHGLDECLPMFGLEE